MKFTVRKDRELQQGDIVISCNYRDYEATLDMVKDIQKKDIHLSAYDDLHNMFLIPLVQIYYIENIDGKVYIYTKDQVYRIYHTFSYVKKAFVSLGIQQINKSTLVNTQHIQTVKVVADCRRLLCLDNDDRLLVNRHYKDMFLK